MESCDASHHLYQSREPEESLKTKMAELTKTKQLLKSAKDKAVQSWLDSRPLIDELDKQQSNLATANNQSSMSNIVISELETQLETTYAAIKSKKEDQLKAKTAINETSQAIEQTRDEMETLKLEMDEARRDRLKVKQVLRLKRQTLRTLLLTLRAIRLETEAFGTSEADAVRDMNRLETDNTTIELTQQDYHALTRRAKEETSLGEWRVSVSMEQKIVAEAGRDSALRRLNKLYSDNKSRMRERGNEEERMIEDEDMIREVEPETIPEINDRQIVIPKAQVSLFADNNPVYPRSRINKNKNVLKRKKKQSIVSKIKGFLVRRIWQLFA